MSKMAFPLEISLVLLFIITTNSHPTQIPVAPNHEGSRLQNAQAQTQSLSPTSGLWSSFVNPNFSHAFPDFDMPQSDSPQELINLGPQVSPLSSCATVLTTSNCLLQMPDDASHKSIEERNFIFAASLLRDQCSLTVRDCSGDYSTYSVSTNFLFPSRPVHKTVSSVCCECNGCNRPNLSLLQDSCAILFEHEKCSLCYGFRLEVQIGDMINNMNAFVDDRVSSIYVAPGCELLIFQDPEFQGLAAKAQGSLDYLPNEWNDVISSFQCHCNSDTGNNMTTTPKPIITSTIKTSSISPTTTENHILSTTETSSIESTTTNQNQDKISTTEAPITSTSTTMKTTTIGPEYHSTSTAVVTTTRHEESTTTSTERVPVTTTTGEPTTVFDDSNSVY